MSAANYAANVGSLQNDAVSLAKQLSVALSAETSAAQSTAWSEVIATSGKLLVTLNELSGSNAQWLPGVGALSNLAGAKLAADKIAETLARPDASYSDLKVADVLGYVGGLCDVQEHF